MRLWHFNLIPYLPRQQLIAQWRECCVIASNLAKKGTPNHLLVNKILDYHYSDFTEYANMVIKEMNHRGYKVSSVSKSNFEKNILSFLKKIDLTEEAKKKTVSMFANWHTDRYLIQCIYNLQEKYDCGGINQSDWEKIEDNFEKWCIDI